jgi:hypothetical protein
MRLLHSKSLPIYYLSPKTRHLSARQIAKNEVSEKIFFLSQGKTSGQKNILKALK